ncbi:cytochrome P450 [Aspergillus californicus]
MAGATYWWKAYKEVIQQQTIARELFVLHQQYGGDVRIAPNELHFGNPSAFHGICHNSKRWDKDSGLYRTPGFSNGSFVLFKYAQTKERREAVLPIFSKKAIKSLEHLVWRNLCRPGVPGKAQQRTAPDPPPPNARSQCIPDKGTPDLTALHDEAFTLISAGALAVSDALLMGHWHMLRNQPLLSQLRQEITTLWPDLGSPSWLADLEGLALLTATIKESLRLSPPGASFPRVVPPSGAQISGYSIPQGTVVNMEILHVHQSRELWGRDILEFRPKRWLNQQQHVQEETPAISSSHLEHWLVPCSRGARMCIGTNLAWAED